MKKKYLTCAGIISAAILVIMFAGILLTGSFSVFSSVTIDPIPDHATGDLVVITGTTNRMAGTVIELDIIAVSSAAGTKPHTGTVNGFIARSGGMSNTWSAALDTSAIPPGEYLVNAYWINETVRSDLLATSRFRLTGTKPAPTGTPGTGEIQPQQIRINPPGTLWRGETLLVTGTTSLPEGTELIYLVIQQSNTSVFTVDPKTGNREVTEGLTRSGVIRVRPGTAGVNRWSFAEDSTKFIPSKYLIIVTLESISPEKIGLTSPFDTAPLIVKEAILNSPTSPAMDASPCRYITIDAFPISWTNQTFTITGTTDFPPGTELLVQVYPTEYDLTMNPEVKHFASSMSGALGSVTVEEGTGSTGLWSLTLDTEKMDPDLRKYVVNISNSRIDNRTYETISGDTYCSKRLIPPSWSP
ncbi:MAG: hypothetical protein PHF57_13205 [Methanoregula sp.]|jgi:hypothetical protein|nr:hypothetical protein [Methanoregula sp.]MDD5189157.1 hypothetical protein [Methanoregula sp.]